MEELQIKNKAEKLQEELNFRGKYYFKGFANLLSKLSLYLQEYAMNDPRPDTKKNALERLNKIVKLYKSIPFEQITSHPDYGLLMQINQSVLKLSLEVESVFSENKSVDKSREIIQTISEKGQEYRARLTAIQGQLNSQPGHEQDGLKVIDIHGKVWENAL